MLRLMTKDGFSSALMPDLMVLVLVLLLRLMALALGSALRPWNETLAGESWATGLWREGDMVAGAENKVDDEAAILETKVSK